MSVHHPYQPGEVFGSPPWRTVYLGADVSTDTGRFYYLHSITVNDKREFHITVKYGAGSYASSNRAENYINFWREHGFLPDIRAAAEKAIAEWPEDDKCLEAKTSALQGS